MLVMGHGDKTMFLQEKSGIDIIASIVHPSMYGEEYSPGLLRLPNMDIALYAIAAGKFLNAVLRKSHTHLLF
jgi:hypothetical protein